MSDLTTRLESIVARFDAWAKTADAHAVESANDRLLGAVLEFETRAKVRRECAEIIREAIRKLATKEKRGTFIAPTLDEVITFASEKMPTWPAVDIERWWRHFESVGWKVNNKPMVKWTMAAQNGFANWREKNPQKSAAPERTPPTWDQFCREKSDGPVMRYSSAPEFLKADFRKWKVGQ